MASAWNRCWGLLGASPWKNLRSCRLPQVCMARPGPLATHIATRCHAPIPLPVTAGTSPGSWPMVPCLVPAFPSERLKSIPNDDLEDGWKSLTTISPPKQVITTTISVNMLYLRCLS